MNVTTSDSSQSQTRANISNLLVRAGAGPPRHGKKWDCPACNGKACLSVDEGRQLYHCFHAGCDFEGNARTLARRLGCARRLSPAGYRAVRESNRRVEAAADWLCERVRAGRLRLGQQLADLAGIERAARDVGPGSDNAWDALAEVYARRTRLEAELFILEYGSAKDLLRFFRESAETQALAIDNVLMHDGLTNAEGRFVPLAL